MNILASGFEILRLVEECFRFIVEKTERADFAIVADPAFVAVVTTAE